MNDLSAPAADRLDALERTLADLLALTRLQLLGPDRVASFIYNDHLIRMWLPHADVDSIQQLILAKQTFFEVKFLAQVAPMIAPGAVVVDAGANIGNHTVFFSKVLGAGEVWAFEVMRETFKILQRNIALNDLRNVRAFNVGLGAEPGRAELSRFKLANIGGTEIRTSDTGDYPIQTIDGLGLERLDFLKIDVEGGQIAVLEGARQTLARCRPLIWVEMRHAYGEVEPGTAMLDGLGYRLQRQLTRSDFIFAPAGDRAAG